MAAPVLLLAAHGTESQAGSAQTAALADAVAAARPELRVGLCFLDVVEPSLGAALDGLAGIPAVVVPLLLSTGYHVQTDIPAVVAGRTGVRVARHLGPDPLVIDALSEQLQPGPGPSTVLVSVGSSRPEARSELDRAARLLAERLGRAVTACTIFDDVRALITGLPAPVEVVPYLLAEGRFLDRLRAAAVGLARIAPPLGAHPAVAALVLTRYDEVA